MSIMELNGPTGQEQLKENPEQLLDSPLDDILRAGARKMLQQAVEAEVEDYISRYQHETDENGHRLVVRNGHSKERTISSASGLIPIRAPRVNDKRIDKNGDRMKFSSKILPPYLRKAQSINELIPWLYLKGISTGDMADSLKALLGENAKGLSSNSVVRLKKQWEEEYKAWNNRDLSDEHYVYIWADGIYCKVRLTNEKQCILVIMGATADGRKHLLAVEDGFRESEESWAYIMEDLIHRGLKIPPKLAVGDGALGFWAALNKVFPSTKQQRCWVHKTANVLNCFPKCLQRAAKNHLHNIWQAPTEKEANKAFDFFVKSYEAKYPKATDCLEKDRDELLTFYSFPAQHWVHLRTTNPIESTFATVRLRHKRTKGCGSAIASLTMVFKLAQEAQKRWQRLRGHQLIQMVIEEVKFKDGEIAA